MKERNMEKDNVRQEQIRAAANNAVKLLRDNFSIFSEELGYILSFL